MTRDREQREFLERYNRTLEALGAGVRVTLPEAGGSDLLCILDLDGKTVGDLPRSVDAAALTAVMRLVEQAFEDGVQAGRAIEKAAS